MIQVENAKNCVAYFNSARRAAGKGICSSNSKCKTSSCRCWDCSYQARNSSVFGRIRSHWGGWWYSRLTLQSVVPNSEKVRRLVRTCWVYAEYVYSCACVHIYIVIVTRLLLENGTAKSRGRCLGKRSGRSLNCCASLSVLLFWFCIKFLGMLEIFLYINFVTL